MRARCSGARRDSSTGRTHARAGAILQEERGLSRRRRHHLNARPSLFERPPACTSQLRIGASGPARRSHSYPRPHDVRLELCARHVRQNQQRSASPAAGHAVRAALAPAAAYRRRQCTRRQRGHMRQGIPARLPLRSGGLTRPLRVPQVLPALPPVAARDFDEAQRGAEDFMRVQADELGAPRFVNVKARRLKAQQSALPS